jgi:hypothetical protein
VRLAYRPHHSRTRLQKSRHRAEFTNCYSPSVAAGEPQQGSVIFLPAARYFYEHNEQARAPQTNGPRDVAWCGALKWGSEFITKAATLHGGSQKSWCSTLFSRTWPSFSTCVRFTSLSGLKSSPSYDLGLQCRSHRARGRKAPRGALTCRPGPRCKTR